MKKTQVYHRESGHLGQYEEWWHLVTNDDGTHAIENSWHNVKVNGLSTDEGSKTYSLEEGLREAPLNAAQKIKQLLGI